MSNNYSLIKGDTNKEESLRDLVKKFPLYKKILESIANTVKCNCLTMAELEIIINSNKIKIKLLNISGSGELKAVIIGDDNSLMGQGEPYYSNWNGLFYRFPHKRGKPYVVNGQHVKKGVPIGIIYINKNEQFILSAPADGRIYFSSEYDKNLDQGVKIAKNDSSSNNKSPIFYIK